ncbi:MAG TPA: ATP-binding protein [Actinomycetes bacterium]
MCELTPRAVQELPATREAPALARQFLRERSCPPHARQVLDEAVLLVSELVTNSVLHGGPPIIVAVDCAGDSLQVRVRDGEQALPAPRHAASTDESGRGLELVDLISTEWGVDPEPDGKHVWFVLR